MTLYEKLDGVLYGLMYGIANDKVKKLKIRDVIRIVGKDSTADWEVDHIYDMLLGAGYIARNPYDPSGEPYSITHQGKEFILAGGYQKQNEHRTLEYKIKTGTVESFKYGKLAFWISVISLIIACIALFKP